MKIFIHDFYEEEGCTFCGDDGARYGLVQYLNISLNKKMPPKVTPLQLRALIATEIFPEKQQLLDLLEQYPKSEINIM